jgi:7-keto-8-aminopelargonate synthetase-like enzyme
MGRVDIITGTLGKALGGAMGGYTTAKKEVIEHNVLDPYFFQILSARNCWSYD